MMVVYRCEDTLESIFTAVYMVYEEHRDRGNVYLSLDRDPMLFTQEVLVRADHSKWEKVIRTLQKRFGQADYESLCMALTAPAQDKGQAVFKTIISGIDGKRTWGHLFDDLANPDVNRAFKLALGASRENCHLRGFTRFEELQNGILYGEITPKNKILPYLMVHFSDRFPCENFILYDSGRKVYGVHFASSDWYLVREEEIDKKRLEKNGQEDKYQALFKYFCYSYGIKERRNTELQRNMLPLRFRENMPEFH